MTVTSSEDTHLLLKVQEIQISCQELSRYISTVKSSVEKRSTKEFCRNRSTVNYSADTDLLQQFSSYRSTIKGIADTDLLSRVQQNTDLLLRIQQILTYVSTIKGSADKLVDLMPRVQQLQVYCLQLCRNRPTVKSSVDADLLLRIQ